MTLFRDIFIIELMVLGSQSPLSIYSKKFLLLKKSGMPYQVVRNFYLSTKNPTAIIHLWGTILSVKPLQIVIKIELFQALPSGSNPS